VVASEVGASDELVRRLKKEYEEHAALIEAGGDGAGPNEVIERNNLLRRLRLGVLEHKRRAITELRDQNRIDDEILRELQAVMDLEEVRLLEPADTE
jgi:CPA1 family monovalent cation:H+ antiporter